MKKSVLMFIMYATLATVVSTTASAQSLKSIATKAVSSVTSSITTTASSVQGTWTYDSPCVEFNSDSFLASAGGTVAASTVETKLESYYKAAGVTGSTFTFNSDNSFTITSNNLTASGTYTFDSSAKTITMKVTKMSQTVELVAYVSVSSSTMSMVFEADKLLELMQTVSSATAEYNSQMSSISSLASNYNGMKLGFNLKK